MIKYNCLESDRYSIITKSITESSGIVTVLNFLLDTAISANFDSIQKLDADRSIDYIIQVHVYGILYLFVIFLYFSHHSVRFCKDFADNTLLVLPGILEMLCCRQWNCNENKKRVNSFSFFTYFREIFSTFDKQTHNILFYRFWLDLSFKRTYYIGAAVELLVHFCDIS